MDQKTPKNRTFLESWLAVPARTRLIISLGACVVGATGIMVSDLIERSIPAQKPSPPSNTFSSDSEMS